jgi:hypothetical protein
MKIAMQTAAAPSTLTLHQVQAAMRLHDRMTGWHNTDAALLQLARTNPGFDGPSCLLKCVAVNALYGTQVWAIVPRAEYVASVLRTTNTATAGRDLVSRLARMAGDKRVRWSFAAKFCHFFIDEERFPIYDDAARLMLRLHLGEQRYRASGSEPYEAFCDAFDRLRAVVKLDGRARDLDRYLWIAGMYARWLRRRKKKSVLVNAELLRLFKAPSKDDAGDLDAMLPRQFERPFRRSMQH